MSGRCGARLWAIVAALVIVTGCDQRMIEQEKLVAWGETPLFPDGKVVQDPVPGTIARGELQWYRTLENRPEMTEALLERGKERFNIFCSPCRHGVTGGGNGIIVSRGMPAPPSYHIERLRNAPDSHFMTVIAEGYGAMYPYASRVPPADRWAIVAYIRALQLSQHAELAALPADLRQRVEASYSEQGEREGAGAERRR